MTLVISLGNAAQVIQVSDRRLTSGSRIFDDSQNKAGHVRYDHGSFVYSYTGLAHVDKGVNTSNWLMELFFEGAARSDQTFHGIAYQTAGLATAYFSNAQHIKKLRAWERRLAIIITGYSDDGFLFSAIITNWHDLENFSAFSEARDAFHVGTFRYDARPPENPALVHIIGAAAAVTEEDKNQLMEMLLRRVPAQAILSKGASLIQDIADRPASRGLIGKKINGVRLPKNDPLIPVASYFSDTIENQIHLVDMVNAATGAPKILVSGVQISTQDSPLVFPKVRANALCPCGSGEKYKRCHRP